MKPQSAHPRSWLSLSQFQILIIVPFRLNSFGGTSLFCSAVEIHIEFGFETRPTGRIFGLSFFSILKIHIIQYLRFAYEILVLSFGFLKSDLNR